jgi:gluconolactonase
MRISILMACAFLLVASFPGQASAQGVIIKDGLAFSEGPAWDGARYIYFSDIPKNQILRHDTETGDTEVFIEDSGGANGLWVAPDGSLFACEGGRRAVARYLLPSKERQVMFEKSEEHKFVIELGEDSTLELDLSDENGVGTITGSGSEPASISTPFYLGDGRRLSQPNDLWMDADGGIYVTDPVYGPVENREIETEDVHYIAPGKKVAITAATDLVRPNGIIGTPDGKTLYVADHGDGKTYAYDITGPGKLENRRVFAEHGSDGMTLDPEGNLYLTDGKTLRVLNPQGAQIRTVEFPEQTTNVTFGGKDGRTLFITCANSLRSMEIPVAE